MRQGSSGLIPLIGLEIDIEVVGDSDAFFAQHGGLDFGAAEGESRGESAVAIDDPMARDDPRLGIGVQCIAYRSRRARRAEDARDLTICRDFAARDALHDLIDVKKEAHAHILADFAEIVKRQKIGEKGDTYRKFSQRCIQCFRYCAHNGIIMTQTRQQNGAFGCLIYDSCNGENLDKKRLDELMCAVARGDNDAFAELYEQTRKGIFAFVFGYCRSYHTAQDLTQTVYLKVKANAASYRAGSDARAWLFQIAKNSALNELRKASRETAVGGGEECGEHSDSYELTGGEVFDALNASCDAKERQIVILHILWGYKHREIAALIDMPLGTVTWKYNNALKKLREYLTEES